MKLCFGCALRKMEQRDLEQRCAIIFCGLTRDQVFHWYKPFLEGREHVEDEHRSGKPSTSKTDENI